MIHKHYAYLNCTRIKKKTSIHKIHLYIIMILSITTMHFKDIHEQSSGFGCVRIEKT